MANENAKKHPLCSFGSSCSGENKPTAVNFDGGANH